MGLIKKIIWPIIGIAAMLLSIRLLYKEFHNPKSELSHFSFDKLLIRIDHIDTHHWLLAIFFTIMAYTALAGYDRIALQQLGKRISFWFVAVSSFTTYALSHNIGASVFSGAAVRYRAYSMKGLTAGEVAFLVGFCSFTFVLGTASLLAIILIYKPDFFEPFRPYLMQYLSMDIAAKDLQKWTFIIGITTLTLIAIYVIGSCIKFGPIKIGRKINLTYPKFSTVAQQLIIGPLEIIGAAGIIYATLPVGEVSLLVILGAFITSFSIGLLSNAPGGGLGVLELIFITLIPNIDAATLLTSLIIFRLFYLIIPLIISLIIVIIFEIKQYLKRKEVIQS